MLLTECMERERFQLLLGLCLRCHLDPAAYPVLEHTEIAGRRFDDRFDDFFRLLDLEATRAEQECLNKRPQHAVQPIAWLSVPELEDCVGRAIEAFPLRREPAAQLY